MSNGGCFKANNSVPPHSNGVHVPEVLVQHVRHHAQRLREPAVGDLILEIDDDGLFRKIPAHDSFCLAPIFRRIAG